MVDMKTRYYIKCYPENDPTCLHYIKVTREPKPMTIKHTHRRKEATLMHEDYAKWLKNLCEENNPDMIYKIVKARF